MPSPYETAAAAIKTAFDSEFAPEGFTLAYDNLHESLGRTRVEAGISPMEDSPMGTNSLVQETWVEVKLYDLWRQEISPETVVDPRRITGFADRFRQALRRSQASDPGTGRVWYFDVRRIRYPNDPTGNKSRFVAEVRAFGNNSNLVETVA